jgi:ribose 5-phosphate isomerase B
LCSRAFNKKLSRRHRRGGGKAEKDLKPAHNRCGGIVRMKAVGIAADHGGFELKEQILELLKAQRYSVTDFGAKSLQEDDDYPDFVIPLAKSVAKGDLDRGIAICGSGVGAAIAANKVPGARAALIFDCFSAHQGVEDDDMNIICLGGRALGPELAWELIRSFLNARFKGAPRHRRRLSKIAELEEQMNG